MTWLRWFALGLMMGIAALAIGWRLDHGSQAIVADFVQQIAGASVQRPAPEAFTVQAVTIATENRPSILVQQPSRLAWDLTIPRNAWIEMELGLQEPAWTIPGDGVLFRVGISLDGRYDELVSRVVNPYQVPDDRAWIPVAIDLSPYAGRAVSLVFNTGAGLEGDHRDGDLAVWGAPRLVTR